MSFPFIEVFLNSSCQLRSSKFIFCLVDCRKLHNLAILKFPKQTFEWFNIFSRTALNLKFSKRFSVKSCKFVFGYHTWAFLSLTSKPTGSCLSKLVKFFISTVLIVGWIRDRAHW